MARITCPTCGVLSGSRGCTECGTVSPRGRGRLGAARHGWVRYGVVTAPVMAVVMLAVVVFAGLAGFGGAQRTEAVFTNTQKVTGNTLGTATLAPPTALVVTANAGTLVLTWGATPSAYASGYYVYRAVAAGGPWTAALATVAGRATTTWTDNSPLGGTNYYKMTAYRYNWLSGGTAVSSGTAVATATHFYYSGSTVFYDETVQAYTVPAGVFSINIVAKGGVSKNTTYKGGIASGTLAVTPGQVITIRMNYDAGYQSVACFVLSPATTYLIYGYGGDAQSFTQGTGYSYAPISNPVYQAGANGGAAEVIITPGP